MTLPPESWRTLYSVADALQPPAEGRPWEVEAVVAAALAARADARALRRTLRWLEWETRLLQAPLRGFCWLSRAQRRRALARWERSPLGVRRRAFARLDTLLRPLASPQSRPGA